ncbi:hypothetical protein Poli38472_001310 [Pythium oligandrum]|uniref:Enoyl reductase (ER) domain-containing protein n=1 Tax=Pythium oligandrum TaxID=41045 RepID=A0A8K1CTV3_PYTOL|nr:hypothetical protein Poli38472_001310 [Pythium oligandrum]|eukprot:TMW69154.1 hypothetical protein Poli38472_001310 [Pythium oligandrum]
MVASIPATFRAFQYAKHGAPEETLVLNTDIPQQTLTNTQVRIQIHSAAINPVDWKVLQNGGGWLGLTPPTEEEPYFIGFDGAGTVVEVGADVKTLKVGDAVYAMTPFAKFGSVSEYLTIEEEFVAPKPTILDFNDAASLPLAVLTSWQALVTYTNVQKGERVLILGGSGGTGTLAVQIAKALGAYVITTTSARNAGFVKSLGAHEVIDYTTQKWADVIDANSIDVVYDCGMEPASWNTDAQRVLKQNTGRFVTILPLSDRIESPIGATFQSILVKPSGACVVSPTAGCLQAVMSLAHEELIAIVQQERRTYQLLHATNATPRGYNDAKYKNLSNAGLVDQLKFIRDQWETHFHGKYVKELRGIVVSAIEKRNQLAHQRQLTAHGYRQAIATFERLLELIRAPPATLEKVQKLVAMLSQVSSSGDGGAQLSSTSSMSTAKKKKTKKASEPTSEDAAHKARSYAGSRDFANAVHWISKAIDLTNHKAVLSGLYLDRAWYRLELGLFEHSKEDAEQAIVCDRTKVEGYRSLCESLVKLGRRKEALSACRTGLTLDPRNEKLQRLREELKDVDPTLSGDVGSSRPFLSEDSNQLTRQECVDEATIFAKLGDTANAIKWTNCAVKLITSDDPLPSVAPIYVRRAEYFMRLKNFENVLEDTKVALEMRSGKYAKASAMQSEALMALGRLREAQQVFKSALELSPQAPDLLELQSRLPKLLEPPTQSDLHNNTYKAALPQQDCTATSADQDEQSGEEGYEKAIARQSWDDMSSATWASKAIETFEESPSTSTKLISCYLWRMRGQLRLQRPNDVISDAERILAITRSCGEAYILLCKAFIFAGDLYEALETAKRGMIFASVAHKDELCELRRELCAMLNYKLPGTWIEDVIAAEEKRKNMMEKSEVVFHHWETSPAQTTQDIDSGTPRDSQTHDSVLLVENVGGDEEYRLSQLSCNDTSSMIYWATKAIEKFEGNESVSEKLKTCYLLRAQRQFESKQTEEVILDATRVIEIDKSCGEAYVLLCKSLVLAERAPEALEAVERGLRVESVTHIDELQSFHQALRDDLERYDHSAQEKASDTDPDAKQSLQPTLEDASDAYMAEDAVTKAALYEGSELDWEGRDHCVNISANGTKSGEGDDTNGSDYDESPSGETLTRQQCVQEATSCASCGSITEAIVWTSRAIALVTPADPLSAVASIYVRRAEYSIELGEFQDALGDIAKAIEFRQGRYAKASALQSKVLLELNRRDEARQVFSEALEQSPLAPDLVALQHLFPDVTVPLMASLVTKTASEVSGDQAYASALDCLRRYDLGNGAYWATKAIEAYGQELCSTQGIKKLAASYLLRAQCRFELQQHAKVVADVEWALEKDPACAEAYVVYCKSLMRLERPSDAFRACVKGLKIASGSFEVELRSIQADLSQKLGVKLLTLTKELDGSGVITRAECTDRAAQCAEHGDFDAAIVWCTRAMTLISPAEPVALLASLYQRRAQYFIALKQFNKAIDDADEALRIREMRYAKAYRVKCEAFLGMSRVKEAVQVWLEGMKVSPEAPDLLSLQNTLGKAIISNVTASSVASSGMLLPNDRAQSLENPFYASIRHLKSMIKESPNDPRLYFAKASCHLQLKQYGAAQKEAEQAIALGDTSPDTFITLCSVMSELKLYADALTACRRGLAVSPGHSGLLEWESKLCALAPSLIVTPEPTDLSKRSKFKHEAITRMSRRDVGNATFWLTKAIALNTDEDEDLELYLLRAECRFGLSQFVPVLQDAQHVVDRDTANVDGYYWMCKALIGLGRDDEALVACNKGCGFDTQHGDLARIDRELKSKLSARPQPSPPASSQLLAQAAATHVTKHDFSSTIDSLTDAIESMDLSESATVVTARYLNRAECLYTEKECKRALENVDRAISTCDDKYAPGYVTKYDFPDVIELQELHREIEKRAATRKPLAVVCSEVNPEAGLTHAADLLTPRDARKKERRRLIQLGVQCMGQEDYGQADAWLSQAIALLSDAIDPASPLTTPSGGASLKKARVYAHRARCRLASESFVSAHADALLAMKHCPSYIEGYRLACTALMGMQSWKEALDVCDLGLEKEPGHQVLLGLRDEINGKLAALA